MTNINVNELFVKLARGEVKTIVAKEPVCGSVSRITSIVPVDDFHFEVVITTTIDETTDIKQIIADRGLTRCLLGLAINAAESVDY